VLILERVEGIAVSVVEEVSEVVEELVETMDRVDDVAVLLFNAGPVEVTDSASAAARASISSRRRSYKN
jgi:hypothetical protein